MIFQGDCLDVFKDVHGLASIVSDPPGGGSFMSMKFDTSHGGRDAWIREMTPRFRVAREATEPGSWGLFWSFPRTAHWTACALDDAGYEIIGNIEQIHGQGWPKGKSQLKPAKEIWWLVRWGGVTPLQIDRCRVKRGVPLAAHHGTGAQYKGQFLDPYQAGDAGKITQDAGSWPPDLLLSHCPSCRQVGNKKVKATSIHGTLTGVRGTSGAHSAAGGALSPGRVQPVTGFADVDGTETIPAWECLAACDCGLTLLVPAGGSPGICAGCGEDRYWSCPVAELDGQSGTLHTHAGNIKLYHASVGYGGGAGSEREVVADSGGASRFFPTFFYDAKAAKKERQAGCEGLLWVRDKTTGIGWRQVGHEEHVGTDPKIRAEGNVHATIKPVGCDDLDGLMRWLVRLVTPEGESVGDPFCGSGSTALAADIEGHDFVGCDIDPGAVVIAKARRLYWARQRLAKKAGKIANDVEQIRDWLEQRAA